MATIQLKTRTFLSAILFLSPAMIILDGQKQKVGWGTTSLTVTPGTHELTVYMRVFFMKYTKATTTVAVAEGQTVNVDYHSPFLGRIPALFWLPGKIQVA